MAASCPLTMPVRHLAALQRGDLISPLREFVTSGRPYIGASAGTNMAAPTVKTTNDMPIVQPAGFRATRQLALVPFQINCHYLDADPTSKHAEKLANCACVSTWKRTRRRYLPCARVRTFASTPPTQEVQ